MYRMTARIVPTVLCLTCVLAGCGKTTSSAGATPPPVDTAQPPDSPTPGGAVTDLLALAAAGDWGTYVDRYYGEQHKFRPGHDDRGHLVERLRGQSDRIVDSLRMISETQPVLSEDGSVATFHLPDQSRFVLYRAPDKSWKFHL